MRRADVAATVKDRATGGAADGPAGFGAIGARPANLILAAVVALLFLAQLALAFRTSLNWDEFGFLAQTHAFSRGEMRDAMQTFHVHGFQWLRSVSANEVDQVVAGRLTMLLFEAATVGALIGVARRFVSTTGALFAAATYLTFSNVLVHGAAFRTDPMITALMMGALWILLRQRMTGLSAVALGCAVALAGLISIKAVFYLPTLAVAALWTLVTAPRRSQRIAQYVVAAATGAVVFGALYLWHQSSLGGGAEIGASRNLVASAYRETLTDQRLFPASRALKVSMMFSPLNWIILAAGGAMAARRLLTERDDRWKWATALSLAFLLLAVVFYRNAYPYYYVCMLAPAAVLAGLVADRISRAMLVVGLAVLLTAAAVPRFVSHLRWSLDDQRMVVGEVHRMFPTPVPYMERAGAVASFPNVSFFMSTWWLQRYRAAGEPLIPQRALTTPPAFVIDSHPVMRRALQGVTGANSLLPADVAFLSENFIPHWGPVWVAGKNLAPAAIQSAITIMIPGDYTVESATALSIDGRVVEPGSVVRLARGLHALGPHETPATLRWGQRLRRPTAPAPTRPFYRDLHE